MVMFFPCILADSKFTVDLLQMQKKLLYLMKKQKGAICEQFSCYFLIALFSLFIRYSLYRLP